MFRRAVKAQKANEIKLAVKYFNHYLALRPGSSKTHLLLASIYDENLDKPLRAVYHYERFLEYAPNSPEAGNVKKWLAAARKRYYYQCRLKYNDPEDVGALQNTLYTTERELKKQKQELRKLKLLQKRLVQYARKMRNKEKARNAEFIDLQKTHRQTLDELEKTRIKLKEILAPKGKEKGEEIKEKPEKTTEAEKKEKNKIAEPKEKPKEKPEEKSEAAISRTIPKAQATAPAFVLKETEKAEKEVAAAPRTYTVKKGDSLSSISRQFYGSSRYYKLIFAANRTLLPVEKALRPGQVLKIPENIKK